MSSLSDFLPWAGGVFVLVVLAGLISEIWSHWKISKIEKEADSFRDP